MNQSDSAAKAISTIEAAMADLSKIKTVGTSDDIALAFERFERWKHRTAQTIASLVGESESQKFTKRAFQIYQHSPSATLEEHIKGFRRHLQALSEEVRSYPEQFPRLQTVPTIPPSSPSTPATGGHPLIGRVFGERWQIVDLLGEGGQGSVFKVVDVRAASPVQAYALKRLRTASPEDIARQRNEVETLRSLNHPNVIRIHDADLSAPDPYLAMEFCDGGTLFQHKFQWPQDEDQIFDCFLGICDGVAAAHSKNIIHRDLKPTNILFRKDASTPIVSDFGLCVFPEAERPTLTNAWVGTKGFMAPEMEGGRLSGITPRADVYSLGKILFWMVSGGVIVPRERFLESEYELVSKFNDTRLEQLNRVFRRTITEEIGKRWEDGKELFETIKIVRRLIRGGYNVPNSEARKRCTFCGEGNYRVKPTKKNIVGSTTFSDAMGTWGQILLCDRCGHIQLFNLDNEDVKGRWNLPPDNKARWS